jgi:PAS domain S-box-containing protein
VDSRIRRSPWAIAAALYSAVYVALAGSHWHTVAALGTSGGAAASLPLDALAAALFWRAVRRRDLDPGVAAALRLMAWASTINAIAQCSVLYVTAIGGNAADMAWTNIPFLLFYPLVLAALLRLPHARRARLEWWKFALDAATVIIGGVVVVWYAVLHPTAASQHGLVAVTLAFAYPIGDLVLLFGLTTLVLRFRPEHRSRPLTLLLVGQLFGISGDLIGTVLLPATGTLTSTWPQLLYMAYSVATIASGELYGKMVLSPPARRTDALTGASALSRYQLGSPLPYAAGGIVYLLALVAAVRAWPSPLSGLVMAAAPVTLLLMARGVVAVRQNARLLIERAERAGQARLVALLDATTDLVAVADAQGTTRYVNHAGRQMIGIGADEDVATLDLSALYERSSVEIAVRDGVWEGETTIRTRAGRDIPVSQVIVAYTAPGGDGAVSTIMRDISGWKRLDRMKSEFVSTVSHELRTPVTAIRGSLGLLEGGKAGVLPAPAIELIHVARRNCDRLVRLLNDMLDLDKIEAGKLELRPTVLAPADIVRATIDELRTIASQRAVQLCARITPTAPVLADRDRVIQVLTNLVSNAIKFSPAGAAVVVAVEPGTEATARFSVTNPGAGIAAHDMPRLFSRFQQLDSSDGRQHGGTGLGLAIAKAIVEQHGGTIGVDSEPDVATTFWFQLPADPPLAAAEQYATRW